MNDLDQLRATTGFKLTPLQVGPDNSAFAGFLGFAFSESPAAIQMTSKFAIDRGEYGLLSDDEIHNEAGRFIDWLIVNYWGEQPSAEAA